MGVRSYLVEGVSCTGRTTVCRELRRRGHHAVNGDTELAYQGDPATGVPTDVASHEHHLWAVEGLDLRRDELGSAPDERVLVQRLHHAREDVPHQGRTIDATRPLDVVVDDPLALAGVIA